jgi:diguanylate cyclase (GGDEF)-like protein/PAS domain S-box-containing protein
VSGINNACQHYKTIFDKTAAGIIIFEAETSRILEVNSYLLKWLGYSYKEVLCSPVHRLLGTLVQDIQGDIWVDYDDDLKQIKDGCCYKKDGSFVHVAVTASSIKFRDRDCIMVFARDITDRKQAEYELMQSENRFRVLFNSNNDAIFVFGLENRKPGNFLEVNDVACEVLGYTREELLKLTPMDIVAPENYEEVITQTDRLLVKGSLLFESVYITKDGKKIPVEKNSRLFSFNDKLAVLCITRDISERKITQEKLLNANQQLKDIIEFLPEAILVIDQEHRVIAWNKAMEKMTGVSKGDILGRGNYTYSLPFYGKRRPMLIDLIDNQDDEIMKRYHYLNKRGEVLYAEGMAPCLNKGKGAFLWGAASPLYDANGNVVGAIEAVRDITEHHRMKEQLQYLATHDSLTNLPNRYSLQENVKRAVAKAKRGKKSALLFIDIDNFKLVNDTLGHAAGDELLIVLAKILGKNLREGDILARLGGDEFAVLLDDVTVEEAGAIGEELRLAVNAQEPCLIKQNTCFSYLTISIGIVMVDGDMDFEELLSHADIALYSAKEKGRNKVSYIEPGEQNVRSNLSEVNQVTRLIKNALENNTLLLFFQPVYKVKEKKVSHHEVLLRLRNGKGELVHPGTIIPVAEQFGLMPEIDKKVVQASLEVLREYPKLKLFVNLSGISLGNENLLESVEGKIRESGIDPSRIGFEITETAAVKDPVQAEEWIRRLKEIGCRFALDDFGIGFSSFSYLRLLPVDYLKIDGSYVQNLDKDSTNLALVKAINTVAHSLGKKTIAEFVENENVYNLLGDMEVDYGQGYYLGKPLSTPIIED